MDKLIRMDLYRMLKSKLPMKGFTVLSKLLALLTVLTLLTGCCAALAEETDTTADMPENHTVTGVSYPFLLQLSDETGAPTESAMNLYFVNGGDIPYAALSEYTQFLSSLLL